MSSLRRSGIILVLVSGLTAATLYIAISFWAPMKRTADVDVTVHRGTSFTRAVSLFRSAGVFPAEFPFRVLGRLSGLDRSLKPGTYRIPPEAGPLDVFRMIERSEILTVTMTVPEGYTLNEIANVVENVGLGSAEEFMRMAEDLELLHQAGIHAPTFEGFLFPDTYTFPTIHEARDVILAMTSRFREVVAPLSGEIEASGLSLIEVVTLASIVEKEARAEFERPLVASVYLNRLRKKMRLEADPTILYGVRPLGEPIRRSEIRKRTPYNTYVIRGLPPGPIANPGLASIRAVLNPAETDFLYFVANENGTHKFSETLKEHNRAVQKFRKNGR